MNASFLVLSPLVDVSKGLFRIVKISAEQKSTGEPEMLIRGKVLPSSFSHYVPSLIPWVDKKQRFACEVVPIGLGSRIRFPVR